MAVFRCKLSFDKFPSFLREYEVKDTNTLYQLHRCIQNDLDFDEAQLSVFYSSDKGWNKHRTYPLFDMGEGSMDMITIEMLIGQKVDHLLYTFDLYNDRSFKLELLGEDDEQRLTTYPRVVVSENDPPDQLIDNKPVAELPFLNDPTAPPTPDERDDDEEDDDEVEEFFEDSVGQDI
ncbi:MAG: plasmid pRiA4b ORF-3 family protein [Prevotellaceae bacterium]|jgi:hypothetical protein|nr:plasmid pRiA4b ORF-3 family protein [Prevotellaceae bacterium]